VAEWIAYHLLDLYIAGSNSGGDTFPTRKNNLEVIIHSQLLGPTKLIVLLGSIN